VILRNDGGCSAYDRLDFPEMEETEQDHPLSLIGQDFEPEPEHDSGDDMRTDANEIFKPVFNPRRSMWDPVEEQKAIEGGGVRPEA
jgi:hypothetical protein